MTETEALAQMVPPTGHRPSKPYLGCVIQILVTSQCDKACFHCTQGSQLQHKGSQMSLESFEAALLSLQGYTGVVGLFGGNPALHKDFAGLCALMRKYVAPHQRGIWCNNPLTVEKAQQMRETFHPGHSNLNVHLDQKAFDLFKHGWPESHPVGLREDSRHSPPFVAMRDVLRKPCPKCYGDYQTMGIRLEGPCPDCHGTGQVYDEGKAWELISQCDINQYWSAGIAEFRGRLRAWFCEIAMAQSLLHQHEPDYPDTGLDPTATYHAEGRSDRKWWQLPMDCFAHQVRKHCHECGVPLRGYGELSQASQGCEQTSESHAKVYFPKRRDRPVQVVTNLMQLGVGKLSKTTNYLGNAKV